MPGPEVVRTAPLWMQPLRWAAVTTVSAYYRIPYRIRGWGRLPTRRGSTLIVANHQHEIESAVVVGDLTNFSFSVRWPIFTVSSRRMWEPGFFAERVPWLRVLRGVNIGWLFSGIGMQPIENELHSRPFVSVAYLLHKRHGDVPVRDVFRESALARFPHGITMLSDLLGAEFFVVGRSVVTLSELHEPYRREALTATREELEADIRHFEALQRDGASIFITPEGFYSGDGKMQRLRGILSRLQPLATVWIVGISYDPFVGRRLSILYRVQPSIDGVPLDVQLKARRPVTVSALLGGWLSEREESFSEADAIDAVRAALTALPPLLFVEPELRAHPERLTRRALDGLHRLGALRHDGSRFTLTQTRRHAQFPRTDDIVAYQRNFHQETLAGARAFEAAREPSRDSVSE